MAVILYGNTFITTESYKMFHLFKFYCPRAFIKKTRVRTHLNFHPRASKK